MYSLEDPRATDHSIIPEDIQLKATQFLCDNLALKAMQIKRHRKRP